MRHRSDARAVLTERSLGRAQKPVTYDEQRATGVFLEQFGFSLVFIGCLYPRFFRIRPSDVVGTGTKRADLDSTEPRYDFLDPVKPLNTTLCCRLMK